MPINLRKWYSNTPKWNYKYYGSFHRTALNKMLRLRPYSSKSCSRYSQSCKKHLFGKYTITRVHQDIGYRWNDLDHWEPRANQFNRWFQCSLLWFWGIILSVLGIIRQLWGTCLQSPTISRELVIPCIILATLKLCANEEGLSRLSPSSIR